MTDGVLQKSIYLSLGWQDSLKILSSNYENREIQERLVTTQ
jgi:hypothetical protein